MPTYFETNAEFYVMTKKEYKNTPSTIKLLGT